MVVEDLNTLTTLELRERLLSYNKDVPTAVDKRFMILMLQKAMAADTSSGSPKVKASRRSVGPGPVTGRPSASANGSGSGSSRHVRRSEPPAPQPQVLYEEEEPMEEERVISNRRKSPPRARPSTAPVPTSDLSDLSFDFGFGRSSTSTSTARMSALKSPTTSTTKYSSFYSQQDSEEDYEEKEENTTPSPRFQKYYNFFKEGKNMDPFLANQSYASPSSPSSTRGMVGSPIGGGFGIEDSGDESDNDQQHPLYQHRDGKRQVLGNIMNRISKFPSSFPNPKNWFGTKETEAQVKFNFGSTPANANGASASSRLGNQIYSPAPAPQQQKGRTFGLKSFFYRGQKNGHVAAAPANTADTSSHPIARLILYSFAVMVLLVLLTYVSKMSQSSSQMVEVDVNMKDVLFGEDGEIGFDGQAMKPPATAGIFTGFIEWISESVIWMAINVLYLGLACCGVYIVYQGFLYRKQRKMREEVELFDIVEKVNAYLEKHHEATKASGGGDAFVAVNHIRDEFFSPRERKEKEVLWNKVVAEISNNESRVREEIQHISGEEFKVWRWLPAASPQRLSSTSSSGSSNSPGPSSTGLYPNLPRMDLDGSMEFSEGSRWQGPAFEIHDGGPNALVQIPSTCLKIRNMYCAEKDSEEYIDHIRKTILEKARGAKILHIGIDRGLRDGCVYVRCATKNDARIAYNCIHGWWFEQMLVSVKFLREERYNARYPEAANVASPLSTLGPAVSPLSHQNFNNNANQLFGAPGGGLHQRVNINPRYSSAF